MPPTRQAQFTVPEGMSKLMAVELDDGRTLEVEIPEGLGPGDGFEAFIGQEDLGPREEEPEANAAEKPELAENWTEKVSKTSGDSYYYNTVTGEATWEPPLANSSSPAAEEPSIPGESEDEEGEEDEE